jgi:hypothetical protein
MERIFAVCLSACAACSFVAAPAAAQEPTSSQALRPFGTIPPLAPSSAASFFGLGEPTGEPTTLSPHLASTPMRLALQAMVFPVDRALGFESGCETRGNAVGNSVGGIPVQRYTFLQLAPNLVLHGFSSLGCPIDAAIGGGVTYAVPIRPTLWFVAGAGLYGAPQQPSGRVRTDLHLDVVKKTSDGRAFSVGVGRRGFTFGGGF